MADYIFYVITLVSAVIITKYFVSFILSIASIPANLVPIINLILYVGIFGITLSVFYFLPQPRGFIYQVLTDSTDTSITTADTTYKLEENTMSGGPPSTPPELPTPHPNEPTWTPTITPPPAPTWTPTKEPTQKSMPTWTPTKTPLPAPTWTPTVTPPAAPTWTPTKAPENPPTSTSTPPPIITCSHEPRGIFYNIWTQYKNKLGCPHQIEPIGGFWAEQPFQNGHMFWSEDAQFYLITIGNKSGTWYLFPEDDSIWKEGMPQLSCEVDVPAGLFQPVRGFGGIWCSHSDIREKIGWGTDIERGFKDGIDLVQGFENGIIFRDSDGYNRGTAYVLFWEDMTFVKESY